MEFFTKELSMKAKVIGQTFVESKAPVHDPKFL